MSKKVGELNEMVSRAQQALESHFAEIRTNILLDTGHHHPKSDRSAQSRLFRDVSKDRRIRITKNHIQVITKFIRNSIQNRAPDGACFPRNEKELSDQKAAELNESVYQFIKSEADLKSVYAKIIHDFVVQGETHTKVFWDPQAGRFLGYEETGEDDEPDEEPEREPGEDGSAAKVIRMDRRRPKFAGGIVYESIPAYNFLTDPDADSRRTVGWVCARKFLPRKRLEMRYIGDKEKLEIIEKSGKDKKDWFDGFTGIYADQGSDEVELREFYYPPCQEYPEGYFIFATDAGKLEEGTLPDGFCIFSEVYDECPESPRGYSVIKTVKPYQVEINRAAAAAITESIVLGHSTVLYPNGEKPTSTSIGNGIKGLAYHSVNPPTVIPGQTGQNYIDYLEQQVTEMYRVALVPQQGEDKETGAVDGLAMLGRALKDKMRFSLYAEKIENLICKIIDYSLKLARRYMRHDEVIPIVGKVEAVNIAEFKNTQPAHFQIKIQPRSDDFTSVYGKSIQITQALQYVGNRLPPEAVASMIRKLPFLNGEAILKDFTVWEDQADSVVMSLDRGEVPFFFPNTNHEYLSQRLQMRMNEADFPMLSKQIQLNYQERYEAHIHELTRQQQEAAEATAGFIPSGGGLIGTDYYIQTPEGKSQRARLPYEAVDWLVRRLSQQGTLVEKITNLPLANQADVGQSNQSAGVSVQPQGGPPMPGSTPLPMTGS